MKLLIVIFSIGGCLSLCLAFINPSQAAPAYDSNQEIIKALNEQNKQLARIANAVERISGDRPGWKLPNN
jgi:hypothetical protein